MLYIICKISNNKIYLLNIRLVVNELYNARVSWLVEQGQQRATSTDHVLSVFGFVY